MKRYVGPALVCLALTSLAMGGLYAAVTYDLDAVGVLILNSEERVRNDVRLSEERTKAALAKANAATEDKVGVLVRELGLVTQQQRGLGTAWRVETAP